MNVLVTGAAGFLGKECVALLRRGGHSVVTTDQSGGVDLQGDLGDRFFVAALPASDAVVHCAAVQYVTPTLPLLRRKSFFAHNNVLATTLLCDRYAATKAHFVNVGTSMMYEQCGQPIYGVRSPMKGQGVYSESKLAAWRKVESAFKDSATVVPCIIGGIGREGLFRGFVKSIQSRGVAVFPGSGQHKTHMIHVQDVAALIVKIVDQRAAGMFNAAAPKPLSIRDWVNVIADELKLPSPKLLRLPLAPLNLLSSMTGYRILAREQLLMLQQPHVLDTNTSMAIGWQPRFDNERIVRDIAQYIAGAAVETRTA